MSAPAPPYEAGEGSSPEPLDPLTAGAASPRERADAARNRRRVLAAAEELFATCDPRSVTMGQIARLAGVGRATLYRRFPDVASVALALLDEHERRLQHELIRGVPPLGPGADPADRLAAFYVAMTSLLDQHLHLALGAETGNARFGTGAYGFWRAHVRSLLVAATVPDPDALVDPLLAPLGPEVYAHQRAQGISGQRITDGLVWLARRLLPPNAAGSPEGRPSPTGQASTPAGR